MVLVFIAAIKVYQMVKWRSNQARLPTDVFEKHEIELLETICPALQEAVRHLRTKKLQTLTFFVWVIPWLGN